jgi:hypothetical protein
MAYPNRIFNGYLVWTSYPPSFVTGMNGAQALSLTGGSGQYVQLPTGPGPFDVTVGYPFTFECFFQLASLPTSDAVLAQREQTWLLTITTAGDVNLTVSGVTTPLAAGVTLSTGTWYHVAAVYDGSAWYLCVAGNAGGPGPAVTGFDGGAAGPVTQSIGGAAGNSAATLPGLIQDARVSALARYPNAPYGTPNPPLAWDVYVVTIWSMDGSAYASNLLTLTGPGAGNPGGSYPTFAASLAGAPVTVTFSDTFTNQHFDPPSLYLSGTQPFTYSPDDVEAATLVTITATPDAGSGVSPAIYLFYVYSAQAYAIPASAPYGVGWSGLAGDLGYWLFFPPDPMQALYWAPGSGGVTEQPPGSGVYVTAVQVEPGWNRVLEWDAPAGTNPFITVVNTPPS